MPEAHSLEDAANSDNSLQGYVAINYGEGPHGETPDDREEIARLAHRFYCERNGENGSAEEDWYRAEREVRQRRSQGVPNTVPGDSMNI